MRGLLLSLLAGAVPAMAVDVVCFTDREQFQTAVDARFGGTQNQWVEGFSAFSALSLPFFFADNQVDVPTAANGMPTLFSLQGGAPDFASFIGNEFCVGGDGNPCVLVGVSTDLPLFIRFPSPGVSAFFADFFNVNDLEGLDTSLNFELTMVTGETQTETLEINIDESINGVSSFGFLIADDFLGVSEIKITALPTEGFDGDGFVFDLVTGVVTPPTFCCTVQFNTCLDDFCNQSQENCLGTTPGGSSCGDDSFWFPLVEDTSNCLIRDSGCSMSSECCGPLECLPREQGDGVLVCEVPPELLDDNNSRLGVSP